MQDDAYSILEVDFDDQFDQMSDDIGHINQKDIDLLEDVHVHFDKINTKINK